MKIAAVTDDGTTISEHFGRSRYYAVLSVEDQRVVVRDMIERALPDLPDGERHRPRPRRGLSGQVDCHGTGAAAAAWHDQMVQPIRDCQVLLTRGLSWSARVCLLDAGIRPIITDIASIDGAVLACLDGTIVDHVEGLH
jgi:predicted Fe-Mo cluster-binding NifX family protein